MGLLQQWRARQFAKRFACIGPGCAFHAQYLEIKGHVELGRDCVIENNVLLRTHQKGRIVVGDGVELGAHVMIASNEYVEIGDHTRVEAYAVLRDMNHSFYGTDVHWRLTPHQTGPIRIGRECYIGMHSYILPGVTVGDGAIILPRSMVNKDVGPNEIWVGSPIARRIGDRTDAGPGRSLKRDAELLRLYGFESTDSEEEPSS